MIRRRRVMSRSTALFTGFVLLTAASSLDARAEEPEPGPESESESELRWTPNVTLGTKLGSERMLGQVDVLGPVLQGRDALLFMDLRGRIDDDSSSEGNFGLGYRQILADGRWVAGGYGFFDVLRSANDNTFVQGTVGLELSSEFWMGRVNGYLPESRDQVLSYVGLYPEGPNLIGNTLEIVSGLGPARVETALGGFDVELGRRFRVFNQDVWVYGAYYRFAKEGLPTVEGPRLRAEVDLNLSRWLPNAVLAVGGEWETDDVRGSQGFGTLEFRYAFGGARARGAGASSEVPWQDRRMVGRVVRDVDVITGQRLTGSAQIVEPAIYPGLDEPIGSVIVVANCGDNCSTAPGTIEAPNDLATGVSLLDPDSILLVQGDLGNVPTAGVDLPPDSERLQIVGGGVITTVESPSGESYRFAFPGSSPTLELEAESTNPILRFGAPGPGGEGTERNFLIGGVDFVGGGLQFDAAEGQFVLQNLEISDSRSRGIEILNSGAQFSVRQVQVSRSAGEAVWLSNLQGDESLFAAVGLLIDNSALTGDEGEILETFGPGFVAVDAARVAVGTSVAITTGNTAIDLSSNGVDEPSTGLEMIGGWLAVIATDVKTGVSLDNVRGTFDMLAVAVQGDGSPGSVGISIENSQIDSFLGTADGSGNVTIVGAETGISLDGLGLFDDEPLECALCGRFFVQGAASITDTLDSGLRISNSEVPVNFLAATISNPGADAIVLTGNTGNFNFGGSVLFDDPNSNAKALDANVAGGAFSLGAAQVSQEAVQVAQDLFFRVDGALLGAGGSEAAVSITGADRVVVNNPQFTNIGDQAGEHALQIIDTGRFGTDVSDGQVLVVTDATQAPVGFSNLTGDAIVVETTWGLVNDAALFVVTTPFAQIGGDAIRAVMRGPGAFAEDPTLVYEAGIASNAMTEIGGNGISVEVQDPSLPSESGSLVLDLNVSDNILDSVVGTGILASLDAAPAANATTVQITGNTIIAASDGGIEARLGSGTAAVLPGSTINLIVSDNVLNDVTGDGITAGFSNGPDVTLAVERNILNGMVSQVEPLSAPLTAIRLELAGVALGAEPGVRDVDITVNANGVADWGQAGIDLTTLGETIGGDATARISGNELSDIDGPGIRLVTGAALSLDVTVEDNELAATSGFEATGESASQATLGVDLQRNSMLPEVGTSLQFRFESSETVRVGVYCDPMEASCPAGLEQLADFQTVLNLGLNGVSGDVVGQDQIEKVGTNFEVLDDLRRVSDGEPEETP